MLLGTLLEKKQFSRYHFSLLRSEFAHLVRKAHKEPFLQLLLLQRPFSLRSFLTNRSIVLFSYMYLFIYVLIKK